MTDHYARAREYSDDGSPSTPIDQYRRKDAS